MKCWLCMNPVRLRIGGCEVTTPKEALALLGIFKTKKLGREICGPKAEFAEIDWLQVKETKR